MVQWIGIIFFLGFYKKLKPLLKDKKTILKIAIGLFILRNLGFIGYFGHSEIGGLILGFINGGIILAVISLLSNAFKTKNERSDEKPEKPEQLDEWDDGALPGEQELPPAASRTKNVNPYSIESRSESNSASEKTTALAAVRKYLENRNYRVHDGRKTDFDLIAIDSQNIESFITIVAFKHSNNDNEINLSEDKYNKIIELGRQHRLFIVTDCFEDQDSKYMGNYVTIYYLDSPIADTGFVKQGSRYVNNLHKLKKYSYDQEISVRLEL
ncbi:MAG: hypothetical protein P9X26_04765 [Candidatus Stygibacter frigidus]|nr:hypothetical protein [Candidatus Stygibacter frigidus]